MTATGALVKGLHWRTPLGFGFVLVLAALFLAFRETRMFLPWIVVGVGFCAGDALQQLLRCRFAFALPAVRRLVRRVVFGAAVLCAALAMVGVYRASSGGVLEFLARSIFAHGSLAFAGVLLVAWLTLRVPYAGYMVLVFSPTGSNLGVWTGLDGRVELWLSDFAPLLVFAALGAAVVTWRGLEPRALLRTVSGTPRLLKPRPPHAVPQPALLVRIAAARGVKKWLLAELFLARSLHGTFYYSAIAALTCAGLAAGYLLWWPAPRDEGMAVMFGGTPLLFSLLLAMTNAKMTRIRLPVSRQEAFRREVTVAIGRACVALLASVLLLAAVTTLAAWSSTRTAAPISAAMIANALAATWPLLAVPFALVPALRASHASPYARAVVVTAIVSSLGLGGFLGARFGGPAVPWWTAVAFVAVGGASLAWIRWHFLRRDLV